MCHNDLHEGSVGEVAIDVYFFSSISIGYHDSLSAHYPTPDVHDCKLWQAVVVDPSPISLERHLKVKGFTPIS